MISKTKFVVPLFYLALIMAGFSSYFITGKIALIVALGLICAFMLFISEKFYFYVATNMMGMTVKPLSYRWIVTITAISCIASAYYFFIGEISECGSMLGITIYTGHALIRKSVLNQVV